MDEVHAYSLTRPTVLWTTQRRVGEILSHRAHWSRFSFTSTLPCARSRR